MFLISMKKLIVVDYQKKLGFVLLRINFKIILKYQDKLLQNVLCNISSITP